MGEGLPAAPARLDRRGLLRANGVRVQYEPATPEVGTVSLSGESKLKNSALGPVSFHISQHLKRLNSAFPSFYKYIACLNLTLA